MTYPPDHDPWNAPPPNAPKPPPTPPLHPQAQAFAQRQPAAPEPKPDPNRRSARQTLAWLIIAACTLFIAALQFIASADQDALETDPAPGLNTLYIGRMSVGFNEQFGVKDQSMLIQLDSLARQSKFSTTNAMRAAIVAAEIAGRQAAADRLIKNNTYNLEQAEQAIADDVRADHTLLLRIYSPEKYIPTTSEADDLIRRHGWFGKLATGYNLPTTHADYTAPRNAAANSAVFVIIFMVTVAIAFIVGFGLLITIFILFATRTTRFKLSPRPPTHSAAYIETVAVFLVAFLALSALTMWITSVTGIDFMLPMLLLLVLPIFWPLACGVGFKQFRQDMGWTAPDGVLKEVGLGLIGYLAGLPIIACGVLATFLVAIITQLGADHPIGQELVSGSGYQAITVLLAAVVWAPLVEECIFRAAFYRHLRTLPGFATWLLATALTSFIFAAIHPQGIVGVPVLMSIAFVLALLREWRQSLIPCITAHAIHNGMIATMLILALFL